MTAQLFKFCSDFFDFYIHFVSVKLNGSSRAPFNYELYLNFKHFHCLCVSVIVKLLKQCNFYEIKNAIHVYIESKKRHEQYTM